MISIVAGCLANHDRAHSQKWQAQPGTAWPCRPSEGTLARATSTTSEGLCQGAPVALSCRQLARPPDVDIDSKSLKPLKAFLPFSPSLTLSFARFVGIRTHDVSLPLSSRVHKGKKKLFAVFFLFSHGLALILQFAMILALPTYCCTHRVDEGNRLPLCVGEVDFICQVPNLSTINYG